jgi:hypothetical protein
MGASGFGSDAGYSVGIGISDIDSRKLKFVVTRVTEPRARAPIPAFEEGLQFEGALRPHKTPETEKQSRRSHWFHGRKLKPAFA